MVSPFDAVTQAQLRRIRPRGRWIGAKQGWEFPLAAATPLRESLGRRFPLTPELQYKFFSSWSNCLLEIKALPFL